MRRGSLLRKHYALPSEHGAWIWWIGPLLLGTAAAGKDLTYFPLLTAAALAAFLLRQPAAILVKVLGGRRPRHDLQPAAFWSALYGAASVGGAWALVSLGFGRLVALAAPGLSVFIWHLVLVSRRAERGQRGVELVGAGVLSLTAPAAYWITGGQDTLLAWILWGTSWLQAAASIVNVYSRLEYRRLSQRPPLPERLARAVRNLAYHLFNLAAAFIFSTLGYLPWPLVLGFTLMLVDALEGVLRPPLGQRPTHIGLRQLVSSTIFFGVAILGFLTSR